MSYATREMAGKRVVITGANSGIGKAAAVELARQGANVTMVCRSRERGEAAKVDIEATAKGEVELLIADLGDQASLRSFASSFPHEKVDVLMNNAGVYLPERGDSPDGHERMMAINHLGAFLITHLLWEPLAAANNPRVITTSSLAHRMGSIKFDNLQCERSFNAMIQYGVTKLANILFTKQLAQRGSGIGLTATAFHPGAVMTGFAQHEESWMSRAMKLSLAKVVLLTPEQGASTGVMLATCADTTDQSGCYFASRKKRTPSREARNLALAERLWNVSEQLTGLA